MVTAQVAEVAGVPEQAPVQPINFEFALGFAVRVTVAAESSKY